MEKKKARILEAGHRISKVVASKMKLAKIHNTLPVAYWLQMWGEGQFCNDLLYVVSHRPLGSKQNEMRGIFEELIRQLIDETEDERKATNGK